jgi:hypothetical protein
MKLSLAKSFFVKKNIFNKILTNRFLIFFKLDKFLNIETLINLSFLAKLKLNYLNRFFRNKFSIYGRFYFVASNSVEKTLFYLNLLRNKNVVFSALNLDMQFFRGSFLFEKYSINNLYHFCLNFFVFFIVSLIKKILINFYLIIYNINAYSLSIIKKSA